MGDSQPACSKQCDDEKKHIRATNYRYVGGYFGNCSEVAMMHELVNSGPLSVGITVPASFEEYTSGRAPPLFTCPAPLPLSPSHPVCVCVCVCVTLTLT